MIVYIDVVLMTNFVFNVAVMWLLSIFLSAKIPPIRLMLSALLGGGLSLAAFIPYFQPFLSVALRFILPFVMCGVCFLPCPLKNIVINGIYVFLLSFFLSGLLDFLGTKSFFVVIPAVFCVLLMKKQKKKRYKRTTLVYKEKSTGVAGFCDSGNLLEYKGMPVILADGDTFRKLFGEGFSIFSAGDWIDEKDFKYISYSSLGKSGAVPGIVMDRAIVEGRVFDNVILGYSGDEISEKVILSSSMV